MISHQYMKIPTISWESLLCSGKSLQIKELELTHPDGKKTPHEVVTPHREDIFGKISIMPITVDDEIIIIRRYRAIHDCIILELPSGYAETWKHCALEDALHAVLMEKTWYIAGEHRYIGEFSSSSDRTNETVYGYVATHCRKVTDILSLDPDEYIERIVVPLWEFDQMVVSELRQGNIIEPKMTSMMYLWKLRLSR